MMWIFWAFMAYMTWAWLHQFYADAEKHSIESAKYRIQRALEQANDRH